MSYIKEKTTEIVESNVALKCDICGAIESNMYNTEWHNFSHHHQSWGNDSIDSYEWFHVCSVNCYIKQLDDSVKEMEDYKRTAEIDEMRFDFAKDLLKRLL